MASLKRKQAEQSFLPNPDIPIHWENLTAVSYTHLDVYKRQGYKTVEVNVAGRNVLEIRLQEDAVMLEHVIHIDFYSLVTHKRNL